MNDNPFQLIFHTKHMQGPIFLYVTMPDMTAQTMEILEKLEEKYGDNFDFYELCVPNWDRYLTPWPKEACLKNRNFSGEAMTLLAWIQDEFPKENRSIYLVGYSLAGLFSLWAFNEIELFSGAVSCSGSLWYPGWREYLDSYNLKWLMDDSKALVYLSLGDKEPKTRNALMAQVGQMTQLQVDVLRNCNKISEVCFVWNPGGHFTEVSARIVKGISWILEKNKL